MIPFLNFCCYFEGSLAITLECQCNTVGSMDISCTNDGGACTCKTGYTGTKCNECADGWDLYNGKCSGKFLLVLLTHPFLRHNLGKRFSRNLSKVYLLTNYFYLKNFLFESPIPKIPKKAHSMRFLEIFRDFVLEVQIMCINDPYSYCETFLHR